MIKKYNKIIIKTFTVILFFAAIFFLLKIESFTHYFNTSSDFNIIMSSLIVFIGALGLVIIFVLGFYNLIKIFTFLFTKLFNNSTLSKSNSKLIQINNYLKSANLRNPTGIFKVFFTTIAFSFIFSFILPNVIQSIFIVSIIATISFYLLPYVVTFFIFILTKTRLKIIKNRKNIKKEAVNEFDNFRYLK